MKNCYVFAINLLINKKTTNNLFFKRLLKITEKETIFN